MKFFKNAHTSKNTYGIEVNGRTIGTVTKVKEDTWFAQTIDGRFDSIGNTRKQASMILQNKIILG